MTNDRRTERNAFDELSVLYATIVITVISSRMALTSPDLIILNDSPLQDYALSREYVEHGDLKAEAVSSDDKVKVHFFPFFLRAGFFSILMCCIALLKPL